MAEVARSLLASLHPALRCRDSLVFQSILHHLDASVRMQCRGASTRGTSATGCYADRPRVVFDCNILVQAISNAAGPAGRALALLQQNRIEVYVSRAVLKELRAVLQYPMVHQKLPGLDNERIERFLHQLMFRATFLRQVRHVFDYPRAKQDEPYIDLAAAAKANYLVSRDRDLLSLATDRSLLGKQFRQRFPSLRVLNPVAFLAVVVSDKAPPT